MNRRSFGALRVPQDDVAQGGAPQDDQDDGHRAHAPAGESAVPVCPVFGTCGGCAYQDIPYAKELEKKELFLRGLLGEGVVGPIVASPEPYHYRNRLDLGLLRMKTGESMLGFMAENRWHVIPIDACPIARREISDFVPQLHREAVAKLPKKYRFANLVVKTGDDKRVRWGGIGRRSTRLPETDYLWTELGGARVHYSLDTFFQANLAILPLVLERLESWIEWTPETVFYDLYGGVGLFGLALARHAAHVVIVEDSKPSGTLARYNISYNRASNVEFVEARVEDALPGFMETSGARVLFVDPPRRGLSPEALESIAEFARRDVFYLSCNPESLARDAKHLASRGIRIESAVPFDFFPKTKHLETLAHFRKTSF